MDLINIIDSIEAERVRQGMSIQDLAMHSGICRATYYHGIEDRALPRLKELSAVLDVLGMSVEIKRRKTC